MHYIIQACNSVIHPHPHEYTTLEESKRFACEYSLTPLEPGCPTYGVFEVDGWRCVAVAVEGVVYVRDDAVRFPPFPD
jgi:hypothetical protein